MKRTRQIFDKKKTVHIQNPTLYSIMQWLMPQPTKGQGCSYKMVKFKVTKELNGVISLLSDKYVVSFSVSSKASQLNSFSVNLVLLHSCTYSFWKVWNKIRYMSNSMYTCKCSVEDYEMSEYLRTKRNSKTFLHLHVSHQVPRTMIPCWRHHEHTNEVCFCPHPIIIIQNPQHILVSVFVNL